MKQRKINEVFTDSENFNPPKRLKCVEFSVGCRMCVYSPLCKRDDLVLPCFSEHIMFVETDETLTELSMKEITIYEFQLKAICEALRICANVMDSRNKSKAGRSCLDRMITKAERYAINALNGEKDVEVTHEI